MCVEACVGRGWGVVVVGCVGLLWGGVGCVGACVCVCVGACVAWGWGPVVEG